MKKLILLLLLSAAAVSPVLAQKFAWDVRMGTYLDNGEYNSSYKAPQTMGGVWLQPTGGLSWGEGRNRVLAGVNYLQEFGVDMFTRRPDLLVYCNYRNRTFKGWGGLLPRDEMKGNYSRALFSDSVGYFKHSLAGALLQWEGTAGEIEVFFDWNSLNRVTGQESFMAGSAGSLKLGKRDMFRIGYAGYMYHYRCGEDNGPSFLVDNVMYQVTGSVDFAPLTIFDRLSLEVGMLGSLSRGRIDENNSGSWIGRAGFQAKFDINWHGWGLQETFYAGGKLLPLFDYYGTKVYWGDAFYNAPVYSRTDVYWEKKIQDRFDIRVALVFNATAQGLDFCQQATVRVHLWK